MRILVHGLQDMNRAINGDTVAVFLFPNNQWRAPEGRFRIKDLDEIGQNGEDLEGNEDEETSQKNASVVPTGRIVGIIKRSLKQYCGILEPPSNKSESLF
jgi:exosome complex exonuclease DIS3/RRP44